MSERIPAAAVDGLEYAWVGETEINARDSAGRLALKEAVSDARAGTPVRLRAVVYKAGYNRNAWTIKPSGLNAYAKTATGRPLLYRDHDPVGEVIGRVDRCWTEKGEGSKTANEIHQEFTIWGPPALADLGNGLTPQFSIHAQPGESTVATCTICEADFDEVDGECSHWPGLRYNGQRASIQFAGDLTHAETTWTYTPAVPGTGLESTSPSAVHIQAIAQRRADARAKRQLSARNQEDQMSEKPIVASATEPRAIEPVAREVIAPDKTADRIAALEGLLASERTARAQETALRERLSAQVEMMAMERMTQESQRIVRDLRARGKLIGDESVALDLRAKSPEVFDGVMALVPANHAYALGQNTGVATTDGPMDLTTANGMKNALAAAMRDNPKADPADLYIQLRNQNQQRATALPIQREM